MPALERLHVNLYRHPGKVAPRLLCELRAKLDAHNGEFAREQWARRLAGCAADLQQARARVERRQLDEVVE